MFGDTANRTGIGSLSHVNTRYHAPKARSIHCKTYLACVPVALSESRTHRYLNVDTLPGWRALSGLNFIKFDFSSLGLH
jgi:hypothetical protein